jgi:hypothetical protein
MLVGGRCFLEASDAFELHRRPAQSLQFLVHRHAAPSGEW